jgi:hypothetical protein
MFANGFERLLEEAHYHMVLVSQQYMLIPTNFIYSGNLKFSYILKMAERLIPEMEHFTCDTLCS